MDQKQSTQSEEPKEEISAEVGVVDETEAQKKAELEELRKKRAAECTKKFAALLEEYGCYTDISMSISTRGRISGTVTIIAK